MRILPITVVIDLLACLSEACSKVCTGAEYATMTCDDDTLDSVIDVEKLERLFHLFHHGSCKCIVVARSIERQDLDWRDT